MKANEKNFIALIRQQNDEGILYVIDTYGGYLHAIVRQRLSALPDKIDECMNDIFLGIWKNIDSYDENKGSFQNWIAGIARLEAIDYLRKASREYQTVSLDQDFEQSHDSVSCIDAQMHALIEKELSEETTALLSCLSAKDRELFYRIYGNEESPEQVSAELGMTTDNLYVRLFRGKKKMRAYAAKRKG
ncbi:MAG: sigma-70 family RNA polymerase sigma factor [Lachnospiraceae bacterium]|nr:sigma-70 family RNA polymerase sigma factor [Lachnospiraceae bacterium]MDE7275133.1 sigma-70 family RNA polymerase sigma factor [Lachnospiraceae bacterium]